METIEKSKAKTYEELSQRLERKRKISHLIQSLETKNNLTSKGKRKKIKEAEGDLPAVFEWEPKRKK